MPLHIRPSSGITLQPRGVVNLLLLMGLFALAYTAFSDRLLLSVTVAFFPAALLILIAGMQYPILSFLFYCTIVLYFSAIYRYSGIEGLSGIMDICLAICLFSLLLHLAGRKHETGLQWKNMFNVLSVGQICWTLFILSEQLAPYTSIEDPVRSRGAFYSFLPCLLAGLFLDTPKKLRNTFLLLGLYIATAAAKLYWQKSHGWDQAEMQFLLDYEAWHTHLLVDGTVRYFSFFTDAGNFGASMGVLFIVFCIAGIALHRFWARWFCIGTAALAAIGLFMSGTRGALVIPFVGIFLCILLSKNFKYIFFTSLTCVLAFCFFYFTDIGDGNRFIRRARTAFHPTEDASYNVRAANRKIFAHYLADKPFGVGIGGHVKDTDRLKAEKTDYIPPDSSLVDIWAEYGISGLCVYLLFMGIVISRGCYVLLFKVRHPQLRIILGGMLGAVFGLLVNAYVGEAMGATPCNLLVPVFLSFVLNGPYIDKQIATNKIF